MATRKKPHTDAQPPESGTNLPNISSVSINRDALITAVVYGSKDRLETVYRETARTIHRLGLKPPNKMKSLPVPDEATGTLPNTLDLQRWLDSLEVGHTDDVEFMAALFHTAGQRCSAAFKKSVADELE